nr:MAG TPA: hypothetical protein [Caudoviricetes sp.]
MGLLENALSLRTSAHAGVAIPRIFKHLGSKTSLLPFNRGAATPVTAVTGSQRHTFLTVPSFLVDLKRFETLWSHRRPAGDGQRSTGPLHGMVRISPARQK